MGFCETTPVSWSWDLKVQRVSAAISVNSVDRQLSESPLENWQCVATLKDAPSNDFTVFNLNVV